MTNVSAAYGELTTQFYSCFYYYHNPNYFSRWQSAQLKNTFPRLLCWLGLARCCNFGRWDVNKSLSTRLSVMFLRWQPCPSGICLSPCPPHFVLSVPETVYETMQTESTPQACGETGIEDALPMTFCYCHISLGFSFFFLFWIGV